MIKLLHAKIRFLEQKHVKQQKRVEKREYVIKILHEECARYRKAEQDLGEELKSWKGLHGGAMRWVVGLRTRVRALERERGEAGELCEEVT